MNAISRSAVMIRSAMLAERERERAYRMIREPEFLPAALEVLERPVSPTARVTAWLLIAALLATLAWLVFGRVDVVVSAPGSTSPQGSVKLVQAPDGGIIRRLLVREGDPVRKGQLLIELDPTQARAVVAQSRAELQGAALAYARAQAVVDALTTGRVVFRAPAGVAAEDAAAQRRLVEADLAALRAQTAEFEAARAASSADVAAANAQQRASAAALPKLDEQIAAIRKLTERGYAPRLRLVEMERQRAIEAGNARALAAQAARARAETARAASQLAKTGEGARQSALASLAEARTQLSVRQAEHRRAVEMEAHTRLRAPENGTVQQLAVHTVGGVVEPAKPLMVVVPEDALLIEAQLPNRDIAAVRAGSIADVKFDAYPFTRYGSARGRVVSVSKTSVADDKGRSFYIVRIALDSRHLTHDGQQVLLTSGLATTSDIRVGKRRLIDYLLEPVLDLSGTAGRER
ncbi:secretion protein HylD [Sphingomonas spermidinifaciens]|uniref:Membrane fusion protein (MFP) family protein n=1 Tax=Sphingomonas spermidinifaciens TaxID=1141889 RepID=A0A2A4B194_9SPHN|nr:HlyD family type I secretion periplasmic adaptor subunit [Sphingomonas spermidinifaciens]PCD01722.1 secretion protein HylD [Sphingomonas spermidinifaciens]